MGYKELNFVKCLECYRVLHDQNPNTKSRRKRREPRYCELGKSRIKEEILLFHNQKIERNYNMLREIDSRTDLFLLNYDSSLLMKNSW